MRDVGFALTGQADRMIPRLSQLFEGAGNVHDAGLGHGFDGANSTFGNDSGDWRGIPGLQNERAEAECGSRPVDGPKIVGV